MNALEVRGLTKLYGSIAALGGVDLEVGEGELVGLLGPNGAGKSTTTEILEGYRRRTGGTVHVLGHDPERGDRALRERMGIVLQECGVPHELSVAELLAMYGRAYPRRRPADELIELVGLEGKRNARARTLSDPWLSLGSGSLYSPRSKPEHPRRPAPYHHPGRAGELAI